VNQFLSELTDLLKEKGGQMTLRGKPDSPINSLSLIKDKTKK
jgi:hypothetical protein